MGEPVFVVTFACENCGEWWTVEFEAETRVFEKERGVQVRDQTCDDFGHIDCETCYTAECPTCELAEDVVVPDRSPIEDG